MTSATVPVPEGERLGGLVIPTRRAVAVAAAGVAVLLLVPWVPALLYVVAAFDALLVAAIVAEGWSLKRRASLRFAREAPRRFSLGEEHRVKLSVHSFAPYPLRLEASDAPPDALCATGPPWRENLEAFATAHHEYRVRASRRGEHHFGDVGFRVSGPLGLAAISGRAELPMTAQVFPSLKGLRRLELAARFLEQSSGFRSMRREGGGNEFEKLREYLPDDDFRHIDWKATARRLRPATRVYESERNQTVVIGLDLGRAMAARVGELTKLDHAVNAALLVAYAALRMGDQVGLLLFADEVERYLPPRKGRAQLKRITEALAAAEATLRFVDFREPLRFLRARIRRRALLVLFTDLLDEVHVRPLVQYTRRLATRHLPLLVTLSDPAVVEAARRPPATTQQTYEQTVAIEMLHDRETLLGSLRAQGAHLVDAPSDRISTAAVNRYLALKRAGRI